MRDLERHLAANYTPLTDEEFQEIQSLATGDPWSVESLVSGGIIVNGVVTPVTLFEPDKCDCGMPAGFHESDCLIHV